MELYLWLGFLGIVFVMLALDLGVFNRKAHVMGIRESLSWTAVWIIMALLFNVAVYFIYEYDLGGIAEHYHNGVAVGGKTAAIEYLTGYLVEKSLSLDNIFVMSLIFSYFAIPPIYQHRVLFWGILGALILRGVMIFLGAELLEKFDWMIYFFAGMLFVTAVKMLLADSEEIDPDENPAVKMARKILPVSSGVHGEHFFCRENGVLMMTPLFLALLVIETSDVIFAVDSIPAIFGITHDPFLVFTSNIFALLGLRSLYFALAAMMDKFQYLKYSLIVILLFVSFKMCAGGVFKDYIEAKNLKDVMTWISLGVIVVAMGVGIMASWIWPPKEPEPAAAAEEPEEKTEE
ncbi:MAG: TerC family protein [Thermoguttaceae bacterium]|nr:TerC family protein [Thermoguttaceae bacterium]